MRILGCLFTAGGVVALGLVILMLVKSGLDRDSFGASLVAYGGIVCGLCLVLQSMGADKAAQR